MFRRKRNAALNGIYIVVLVDASPHPHMLSPGSKAVVTSRPGL
jgi:hypothetical protein